MSLDEKLKSIDKFITTRIMREPLSDEAWVVDMRLKLTEAVIADIKQAIADEGYTKHNWSVTPGSVQIDGASHMTGQEFYDKFDTEMSKVSDTWRDGGNGFNEVRVVRRAAKQAAGLEL